MENAEPLPKRRRSYSVNEKIAYLRNLETALMNGTVGSLKDFAENYGIPVTTMRKWDLQLLERQVGEGRGKDRTVKERDVGYWPEVEDRLYEWLQGLRDKRLPVGVMDVKERAMQIFEDWWNGLVAVDQQSYAQARPARHQFNASAGWVEAFMKRKKITLRKVNKNTTTLPADAANRIQAFRANVTETIERFEIPFRLIFNMDQTYAMFEYRPVYTLNEKGANTIDVRTSRSNTKLGCTVTLTISATGEKAPAHITFPRKGFVRQLDALLEEDLPENVSMTSSASGWMKEETARHWFQNVFERFIQNGEDRRFLLLVDRYRVHRTEDFGERVTTLGGILDFIPAGCTSLLQPLDLTVMKSFKSHMKVKWIKWKKENTDDNGRCEQIGLRQVIGIISEAWDSVPAQVVVNGFETAFRVVPVDAGPLENIEEEEEEPGLRFLDDDRDDIEMV